MTANPSIVYWKWDEGVFESGVLQDKLEDLLARSDFDLIFVGLHWLKLALDDPQLVAKVAQCSRLVQSRGRKMMLELDARNEYCQFRQAYPEDLLFSFRFVELRLNGEGNAFFTMKNAQAFHYQVASGVLGLEKILGSWL